jgi:hypothetical protein
MAFTPRRDSYELSRSQEGKMSAKKSTKKARRKEGPEQDDKKAERASREANQTFHATERRDRS